MTYKEKIDYLKSYKENLALLRRLESREKFFRLSDTEKKEKTLYLKVSNMDCTEFKKAVNLLEIFDGQTKVVFYDADKKNYVLARGRRVELSEKVLGFFKEILGNENVIVK